MAGLGVHFAISEETVSRLLAAEDDADVISIVEQIEAELEPGFVFPTDEAWDALHRCLTNGTLKRDSGVFPLSHAVLGGVQLCEDQGYLVSLVRADQVSAVADALTPLDQTWLRARYDGSEFPGYARRRGDEDFSYTWRHVKGIGNFFQAAADDGRAVIFTVEL
jgi:hypothetical protein